jgi:hypothetical protein
MRRTWQHGIAENNNTQHVIAEGRIRWNCQEEGTRHAARGNTKLPGGVVTTRVRGTNGYGNATIIAHNNST